MIKKEVHLKALATPKARRTNLLAQKYFLTCLYLYLQLSVHFFYFHGFYFKTIVYFDKLNNS